MKIISFSQQGPRAICILSANGVISSVTLRQPDSSGGTLTYEVIHSTCPFFCQSFTPGTVVTDVLYYDNRVVSRYCRCPVHSCRVRLEEREVDPAG